MKNLNHFDRVEAYIEGQIPAEERRQFEKELEENEDLKKEYEAYLASLQLLDELAFDALKHRAKSLENEKTSGSLSFRRAWAIAAGILLLLVAGGLGYANLFYSNEALIMAYSPGDNTLRRAHQGTEDTEHAYYIAFQAWQEGDLNSAISHLLTIPPADPAYPQAQYFLANLYLETDRPDQAIRIFEALLERNDIRFADSSEWGLVLAYLQKGDMQTLEARLEELIAQSNHPYHDEALSLKRKLDSFWRKLQW